MNHLKKVLLFGCVALAVPAGTALAFIDDPNNPDDCPPNTLCAEGSDAPASTSSSMPSTSATTSSGGGALDNYLNGKVVVVPTYSEGRAGVKITIRF